MEETNSLFSISELLQNFKDVPASLSPQLTNKEKREILMREIYDFYVAEYDKRRKENWKRYIAYLKENRINEKTLGREKTFNKFKRTKKYIREISFDSMCWLLRHIPLKDLPYFTSTGREFSHSGRSFGSWLSQWFEKVFHN